MRSCFAGKVYAVMALRNNASVIVLLLILLSCGGYAQRRVRVRRPNQVNYGRILGMIRNFLGPEIESIRSEVNEQLNATKKELNDAILEIASLKAESDDLRSKNERLSDNLKQLTASTNAEIDALESSNSELRDQVASLKSANVEMNGALKKLGEDRKSEIDSLEASNSELRDEISSLQAGNGEMKRALQMLQQNRDDALDSLESSNSELMEQIASIVTANIEMNYTLQTLKESRKNNYDFLETDILELLDRTATLQAANDKMNATLVNLAVDRKKDYDFLELRDQIATLQAANDKMNATLVNLALDRKKDTMDANDYDSAINGNTEEYHEVSITEEAYDMGLAPGLVEHVVEHVEQPTYLLTAVQEINQRITDTRHELAEVIFPPCDFVYEGNCYFSEVHYYKKTDYADAETICASRQATVAYPLNKEHFTQLLYHTRLKMPNGLRYIYVWIGLKQNTETGEVTTPKMEAAPFLKWYSGQPSKGSGETGVYLYVTKDARDGRQGMFDDYVGYEYHGTICQYAFPPLNDQELALKRADMDWYKVLNGEQLFNYKLFLKKVSYKTAQQECSSLGAGLASAGMRIPAVRSEVIKQVVQQGGEDTWLGLDDFKTAGQWTWNDGVEANDDNTNWYQDMPDASETQCGVVRRGSVYKFAVDSGVCWMEHFYLCEKIA